jgi:hypothetical protein
MKYMLVNDDALSDRDFKIQIWNTSLTLLVYCRDKDHLLLLHFLKVLHG